MTVLTQADIQRTRAWLWQVSDPTARAMIERALQEAAARASRPYVFAWDTLTAKWLCGWPGEQRLVSGEGLKGLKPAFAVISEGMVDTHGFTEGADSKAAATKLRNAIHVAGVNWAERNGLRPLASAFRRIRVTRTQMFYHPDTNGMRIETVLPE